MNSPKKVSQILLTTAILAGLAACGGGNGNDSNGNNETPPIKISAFELLDPTPRAGDNFGETVRVLANGNIVVTDPNDSNVAQSNGAVHLYNPSTQTLIASLYGDNDAERLGGGGFRSITLLANNNFVISSARANKDGIIKAGSVRLVDGTTGTQIGDTIAGDNADDQIGNSILPLPNGNFVIISKNDDVNGILNAGAVRLINGTSGAQIGDTIAGDDSQDELGSNGAIALPNSNFVVISQRDRVNGIDDAGSVILVNGETGGQIGSAIEGKTSQDFNPPRILALSNSNFIISMSNEDAGGVNTGTFRIIDGSTGVQIGTTITGDNENDNLAAGSRSVIMLPNNNIVLASPGDDVDGRINVGSVRLINSTTGSQIGNVIAGDNENDTLGLRGVWALPNNNFVIVSPNDDEAGIVDAGSVRLINGSTGIQIGNAITGDNTNDRLGNEINKVIALENNNFVVASTVDDEAGIVDAGTVRLINGSTGIQIALLAGDTENDQLGSTSLFALDNNNFIVISSKDDEDGKIDAGSVRLINGTSGAQIGAALVGDDPNDELGSRGAFARLNNNIVFISPNDDNNGITNVGSVRVIDVDNGTQVGNPVFGNNTFDFSKVAVSTPLLAGRDDFYVLGLSQADNNGSVDSGLVRLITQ